MNESQFKTYPTRMESVNSANELVFTLEAFDGCCAVLKVKAAISPGSWPEISDQILWALKRMQLEQ